MEGWKWEDPPRPKTATDERSPNPEPKTPNSKPGTGFHHRGTEQRSPQPNRARARARSAVASTGPGLCVRFVPPALSAAGLAEMRFVRHLLGPRWVGRASRRAGFQAV